MKHEDTDSKSSNVKKAKWTTLLWCYVMSLSFIFIGFSWLNDIRTRGYYVDGKHQVKIVGNDGLITAYLLIVGGFLMLAYSIYLTLVRSSRHKK